MGLMHIISLASNYYYLILSMILPYSCAASVFLFCHFDYCSAPIHQSVCNKKLSYYCHHILTITTTYVLSFLFSYTTSQSQKKNLSAELVFHIPTIFLDMIIISIKNYFFIFIIKLIKAFV